MYCAKHVLLLSYKTQQNKTTMNLTNYAITKTTNPKLRLLDNELRIIMATLIIPETETEGAKCFEDHLDLEGNGNDYSIHCKVVIDSFYKDAPRVPFGEEEEPAELTGRTIFISKVQVYCDGEEVYLTSEQRRIVEKELEEKVKLSIIN